MVNVMEFSMTIIMEIYFPYTYVKINLKKKTFDNRNDEFFVYWQLFKGLIFSLTSTDIVFNGYDNTIENSST